MRTLPLGLGVDTGCINCIWNHYLGLRVRRCCEDVANLLCESIVDRSLTDFDRVHMGIQAPKQISLILELSATYMFWYGFFAIWSIAVPHEACSGHSS
jgi:hypothetical protein